MTTGRTNATPSTRGRGVRASRLRHAHWSPWLLAPAMVWAVLAVSASRPVQDRDSYLHVLVGDDILTHHRFTGDPAWVYGPHHPWVTTQWLCEVLFAGLHAAFGWAGLTYFTLACGAGLLIVLTRVLRATVPGPISQTPIVWVVFALAGLTVSGALFERPATVSFVALVVLSGWTWRALTAGEWPRWWVLVGFTWLWAQCHGYWVLVAVAVTLAALLRAVEQRTTAGWRQPFTLALGATVAGALTPAGLFGLYAPVVFKQAAGPYLNEWAPTTLTGAFSVQTALALLVLVAAAWARASRPVPLAQVGWVLIWAVFAATAYRNVVPAVLLVAPVAATAVAAAWPRFGTGVRGTVVTRLVLLGVGAATVAVLVGRLTTGSPLPDSTPYRLYAALDGLPGQRRVLDVYDQGGQMLALTGPHVRVAVDGRADMYGPTYLGPYFALLHLDPGWRATLTAYAPTDVVTRRDYALDRMLPTLGWRVRVRDGNYTLWAKP